eukprot:TRINITY_DN15430_c0_g3_i5.p1 TRINITY_DN15430_c0_g3~~TRINITY_DN15430_c0_g3_i5.p1  ORF type:complete len:125 (+),score=3.49 TRINITY_DN15430_c0_g3_i5:27-377(+)
MFIRDSQNPKTPKPLCEISKTVLEHCDINGLVPLILVYQTKRTMNILFILAFLPFCYTFDFYYVPVAGRKQCFEEFMSAETLVTGEIGFTEPGSVTVEAFNPVSYTHLTLPTNREV